MKHHKLLVCLFLLIMIILCGCHSTGLNPSETTAAPSIESTAPSATEPPGDPFRGLCIGMTWEEFEWVIPENEYIQYFDYVFFCNDSKDTVAVLFNEEQTVESITVLDKDKIDHSNQRFSKIEKGMHILQIVEMLGIPHNLTALWHLMIDYVTDDGQIFEISCMKNNDYFVSSFRTQPCPSNHIFGDDQYRGIQTGTYFSNYFCTISEKDYIWFMRVELDCYFMKNANGDHLIVSSDGCGVIDRVECYTQQSIDCSSAAIAGIEPGIDIFELVSRIGIPHHSKLTGNDIYSMFYLSEDGMKYEIVVEVRRAFESQGDDATDTFIVKDVRLYEEN